jgi:hypothetical protein
MQILTRITERNQDSNECECLTYLFNFFLCENDHGPLELMDPRKNGWVSIVNTSLWPLAQWSSQHRHHIPHAKRRTKYVAIYEQGRVEMNAQGADEYWAFKSKRIVADRERQTTYFQLFSELDSSTADHNKQQMPGIHNKRIVTHLLPSRQTTFPCPWEQGQDMGRG